MLATKNLIRVCQSAHTTHNSKNIVVSGVDAHLGGVYALNSGVRENELKGGVVNARHIAGARRLVLLRPAHVKMATRGQSRVEKASGFKLQARVGDKFHELDETHDSVFLYAFYMHQAGDLKLVLFLVLVCGAHRNGVTSYHDVTRAWRRCAVIGASCPCAPTKGPSG